MKNPNEGMTRRVALSTGLVLGLGAADTLHAAGLPRTKGNSTDNNGPYGLPSLKRLTDALTLTRDQEQGILFIYNEYKHQEHEEKQAKTSTSTSGMQDCINSIKKLLTPDQQKKFDDLLGEKGKKKKT